MSAGDERLPVIGENKPREERLLQSVFTRASEESKMVEALSTFNISYDVL